MELIKDIIKIDNRMEFGKFQTFIESENVVPDKKLDVYDIVDTMGYIVLRKVEMLEGKITCRGSFNYNVIYIADDKSTVSNISGKIEINEVIERDNITSDMELGKTKRGIKVKSGQPANFYCVSCTPWTTFTAVSSRMVNGGAAFFPIITAGKYDDNYQMPVNITIAHAVADGYHIGLFFEYLQKEISKEYLNSNLE